MQMTLAYMPPVLEDVFMPPIDPSKMELHEKMQVIVKTAILQATIGTMAAAFLNMKDNGQHMFNAFEKYTRVLSKARGKKFVPFNCLLLQANLI